MWVIAVYTMIVAVSAFVTYAVLYTLLEHSFTQPASHERADSAPSHYHMSPEALVMLLYNLREHTAREEGQVTIADELQPIARRLR